MTALLTMAIHAVEALDPAEQDRIAEVVLRLAHVNADVFDTDEIDPDHLPDIEAALAEVARGEFATEEEVEAAFARFRLQAC